MGNVNLRVRSHPLSSSSLNTLRRQYHYHDDELSLIYKTFATLATRSPGDTVDKITFLRFFPLPGLLGERLFSVFDTKETGVIDFEEFLAGLSVIAKGDEEVSSVAGL